MAANRIYIQVDFQSSQADAQVAALNRNLANIGTTAAKSTAQAAAGAKGFSVAIEQSSRAASQLTAALAGLAAVRIGASMFEATDKIKKSEIAIATITKSAEAARDVMLDVRRIAKTQPFRFSELAEMAQQLAGFGFQAEKIPRMVNIIADSAAALGKGKIGIDSITLALGQMRTKGLAQGQELFKQLAETGIQVEKYLAPAFVKLGVPLDRINLEIRKMAEKGQLSGREAVRLILDGMEKEFGGSGARMAQLITAQFAKLQDDLVEVGESIAAIILPSLLKVTDTVRDMLSWFNKLPQSVKTVTVAVFALVTAVTALTAIFTFLQATTGIQLMLTLIGKLTLAMEALAIASVAAFEVRSMAPFTLLIANLIPNLDKVLVLLRNIGIVAVAVGAAFNFLNFKVMQRELEDVEKTVHDAMERFKKERAAALNQQEENLIIQNLELLKHQMDIAEAALNSATAALEGGIAAIAIKFRGLLAEVAGNAAATAKVIQAMQIRMVTFAKEWTQASLNIVNATAKARLEEQTAAAGRWMDIQIAALDQLEQVTIESTRATEEKRLKIQRDAAEKALANRLEGLKITYDEEVRKVNERLTNEAPYLKGKDLTELNRQVTERLKVLEQKYNQDKSALAKATEDEIAAYILTSRQRINDAIARDFAQEFERLNRQVKQAAEMRMAQAEARPARTLEERVALERERAKIQVDVSEQVLQNELRLLDIRKQSYEFMLRTVFAGETLKKYLAESGKAYTRDEAILRKEAIDAQAKYRLEAEKKVNDLIYDAQKSAYDNLKDQAGRVFDALLTKSTSVWQAIANVFKTTILTAIRDIVTSQVAKTLFELFNPGQTVTVGAYGQPTFRGGPGTGPPPPLTPWQRFKQSLGGIVPMVSVSPVTAPYNPNAATVSAIGSSDRMMDEVQNAVNPPGSAGAGGGGGTSGGGFTKRISDTIAQYKDKFNIGKTVVDKFGRQVPWNAASPAAKLGSVLRSPGFTALAATVGVTTALAGMKRSGLLGDVMTVGGAALTGYAIGPYIGLPGPAGAILGAGVGLFARGVQRGGAKGLAMTTAGGFMSGAMLGLRFGGIHGMAVGAVVGAAVGAITGTVRLFVKGADEKLRQKIKEVYGIDMRERNIRAQILQLTKEKFGGNMDQAVRSPEVQEIVTLYALSTGQNPTMPRSMYGVTAAQSGAGLDIQPVYSGGRQIASPYVGATQSQWQTERQRLDPKGWYIQLDPQQAVQLFQGQVVNVLQNNPSAVSNANATSVRNGGNRNEQRGGFLEPSTVVA